MSVSLHAQLGFAARLSREFLIALLVGAPTLGYVLLTNDTASLRFILLHGLLLLWFVPLAVSVLEVLVPMHTQGRRSMLRQLGVRGLGLTLAVFGMLWVVALVTGLPAAQIVVRPLWVALLPLFLGYAVVGLSVEWASLRAHALQVEASELHARQAALTARIRPHFLFNTLNCIEQLTDTDPAAARIAVGRLSRLFRAVLDASREPTTELAQELRLVDDYLGIEQIRFGKRFRYTLAAEPDVAPLTLPSTVLLTLVENAIKHGVERTPGPVEVTLSAHKHEGTLHIRVVSPTADTHAPSERGSGYGLHDVRERLRLAHGTRATLELRIEPRETHVDLTFPL